MAANLELAKQRGLDTQAIIEINKIHESLEQLIENYSLDCNYSETVQLFTRAEFTLQSLWGFTEDARYHTWVKRLADKHLTLSFFGRKFTCNDTNQTVVVTGLLRECQLIGVGDGFIDVGRAGAYHRIVGNITEVTAHA